MDNNSNYRRTILEWYQTDSQIIIEIYINNPQIERCEYKVVDNKFKFKYIKENGAICIYKYTLYDTVYSEETMWSTTNNKIIITMDKIVPIDWPSLETCNLDV